uniref:Uncharacterized protein n=1 Tax=Anguilla anguilla TaxID=7936 RepID=A0A0E9PAD9_ANGAN
MGCQLSDGQAKVIQTQWVNRFPGIESNVQYLHYRSLNMNTFASHFLWIQGL